MKRIHIKEKLQSMNVYLEDIVLGDFDIIGEYTAKKNRSQDKRYYNVLPCQKKRD